MNRRFTAVLVIAAASLAPIALAAKKEQAAAPAKTAAKPASAQTLAKAAPLVPVSLAALFEYNEKVTQKEDGTLIAEPNIHHVMVVKTTEEGATTGACTDNAATAAAYLENAALENLARTQTPAETGAKKDQ